jgi:uncharacterized membrane protein
LEHRRERMSWSEFGKSHGPYLVPGLFMLSTGVGLAIAGDLSPHGYLFLFIYLPLIAIGAIALAGPNAWNWREVPLVALLVGMGLLAVFGIR